MDFISPNGDLPYNNNKDDEEIKVKEVNALKINKPIIPSNTPEGDNAAYQIEYEETLSKIQKYKYNLKKEGVYCLTRCCFKNNIKIFFILNSFIFFFMIITAVFQVTATLEYNANVQECQLEKQFILNGDYNSSKYFSSIKYDNKCLLTNYCNYTRYMKGDCSRDEYKNYCNETMYYNGCCNYYDRQVYLGNSVSCTYDDYYYKHLCNYEQYIGGLNILIYHDFSFFENYENFQYIEGKIIYGCLLLDLISFLFMIIVISNEKKKISNKKEMIFKINFFLLFILYIIFAIICSLYCFICLYLFHFYDIRDFCKQDEKKYNEKEVPIYYIIVEQSTSFIVCVLIFFMFGSLKNILISHINLEEKGNRDNTEKYRKTVFNIKEKEFNIEIKLEDELCLKTLNNDNIYIFKKIKIPEIKKNDDIYIFVNNKYIKDQLSVTYLNTYNMNEQVKRLYIVSNLLSFILICFIHLFAVSAKKSIISSRNYFEGYHVYIYIEFFLEICEFMLYLLMFLTYLYLFVKRILNGGTKTEKELKMNMKIFHIFIIFSIICLCISAMLIIYESCLIDSHIKNYYIYYYKLNGYVRTKVIIHLILNCLIFILSFVILFFNFKSKKYNSVIKKDMALFEKDLTMNIPIKFDYIDVNYLRHTLKPIIYKDYQINLFYELEGEKIKKNKIDKYEDSEVNINDASNN